MKANQETVGYLLKTYPKVSETFILQEMLDLEALSLNLEIFSLQRPTDAIMPSLATQLQAPVTYLPTSIRGREGRPLMTHLRLFATHPRRYVDALRFVRQRPEGSAWQEFIQSGCLAWRLLQSGIRHLHAHFATEPAGVAEVVHRLTGIPYSLTCHAKDIFLSSPDALRRKIHHAEFVVTCTEANRAYLQGIADGGTPIHRIYHGLNLTRFDRLRKSDSSIDTGIPTILSVGRFREKKGFLTLIRACRILVDAGHRFRCQIVGYGPLQSEMEELIRTLGLSETLSLCGKKTLEQVVQLYQEADIFTLPCQVAEDGDRDGIPNVFMEAMACQVPVVTTGISGIPELVQHHHNGLLVPQQDPEALALALAYLLDNPAIRQRLGQAGRETIMQQFSSSHASHQLKALFLKETVATNAVRSQTPEPVSHLNRDTTEAQSLTGTIGYILKGFPRRSEAFITNEILLLEQMGLQLHLFSAFQGEATCAEPHSKNVISPLTYLPEDRESTDSGFMSWLIANLPRYFSSHLRLIRTVPRRYLHTAWEAWRLSLRFRNRLLFWPKKVFYKDFLRAGALADSILESGNIRHLHAHFCHGATTMAMFASMLSDRPFSFTAHAKDIYLPKLNPGELLSLKLRRAKFVVTCTEANHHHLQEITSQGAPIHTIYHGVDTARFAPAIDRETPAIPTILSVGRFVEKKGFPFLIEACRIIREHGILFRCRIVGEPDEQTDVVRCLIRRYDLEEEISIEPGMAQDALRTIYQEATVFVLPCHVVDSGDRDGIPNVLAEAMASGVPVISTNVSGIPEIIEDRRNGVLVAPRDPFALAKAIEELLVDPDFRNTLAQAGRETICRIFDSSQTTKQLFNLFQVKPVGTTTHHQETHAACH
jgi:glycosyltransferase involved in cell wall biosynthesis